MLTVHILPPHFFKKAMGILQLPPCVMLSHPKPLDEIQPNLVLSCSHEWGTQQHNIFLLGGHKLNFRNMIMWYIILKVMSSRPGYTEKLYLIKLVTLEWCQKVKYH